MLWITSFILFSLWALGLLTAFTLGGYINILLIMAAVVLLIRIIDNLRVE